MTTTACPDCGRTLRPGARFCGNCGATLPATPAARLEAVPPSADELACPHCGKAVRPEARYCNSCGKPIAVGQAETAPDAVIIPASPDTVRNESIAPPLQSTGSAAPATVASTVKPEKPGGKDQSRRTGLLWVVALVMVAGCSLAVVAGFFTARQFGWLGGGTPLAALPATLTESPAGVAQTMAQPTGTILVAATSTHLPPTQPATLPPAEPSPTPTLKPPATEPAAAAETPSVSEPGGVVLFEDLFDSGLREHWVTWGEPRATIGAGFGDNWLYLKAIDPGQAGVTTRREFAIPNAPGAEIEFDAQMDERYPLAVLLLDWDPATFDRGPDNQAEGVIRLEIRGKQIKLWGRATREACEQAIPSAGSHTYQLRMLDGQGVALYLDGVEQPICQIASMEMQQTPGKLSFSGLGWVSRVKVTLPQ